MTGVSRFYDEYYFRPKVAWRIMKNAMWDAGARKRLYQESVAFLKLRKERKKWAGRAAGKKVIVSVPDVDGGPTPAEQV